jgi:hypothetical protein
MIGGQRMNSQRTASGQRMNSQRTLVEEGKKERRKEGNPRRFL